MREVQQTIGPLSNNTQEALREIEQHLVRMQFEIWQLKNEPSEHRILTGDATLVAEDDVLWCDNSYVIELIDPTEAIPKEYHVKNIGDGTVTVYWDSIDDVTVQYIAAGSCMDIYPYEASNWYIV